MNREELIYLAGFVDGEGCITCMRSGKYYNPALIIVQKDSRYMEWLATTSYGGTCYQDARGYWIYKVTGKACIRLLKALTPFLKLKQPQAIVATKILEAETIEQKEAIRDELKLLKKVS